MNNLTPSQLRERFFKYAERNWCCKNTYSTNYKDIPNKSGIYFFAKYSLNTKSAEIVYVGSSTDLKARYKAHRVPNKIRKNQNCFPVIFFKEMEKGFYDYEIKLINKLKPELNYQHTHRGING